jgi:CxxC-x17-CxxC domain-containing protein
MSYQDRRLTCVDCGQAFTFSADDQSFHAEKGFTNDPKRCPSCRQARRDQRSNDGYGDGYNRGPREMHSVICAECGKDATVPFRPRGDRPVYCSDCYSRQGGGTTTRRY